MQPRYLCPLLTTFLGVILAAGTAARTPPPAHQPVVQLRVNGLQGQFDAPVMFLATVVQENRKARYFRVSWDISLGGWAGSFTALYDRRKKTVRFFSIGSEEAGPPVREHYLYTGVTEAVLQHLAEVIGALKKRAGGFLESGSFDAFFQDLPKYGCLRHAYPDNKPLP